MDDINDEGTGSTTEAVDQAIYQSSAHLLSMFLEKLVIEMLCLSCVSVPVYSQVYHAYCVFVYVCVSVCLSICLSVCLCPLSVSLSVLK